jgi:hypothetical protein
VEYVLQQCSGIAAQWAQPYINRIVEGNPQLNDPNAIEQQRWTLVNDWSLFKEAFLNFWAPISETDKAEKRILRINPKNYNSIEDWVNAFQREASNTGFDDAAKLAIFKESLPPYIKTQCINPQSTPDDYQGLIEHVIRIAESLGWREWNKFKEFNRPMYRGGFSRGRGGFNSFRSGNRGSYGNNSTNNRNNFRRNNTGGFIRATETEGSQVRQFSGRCYQCGQVGHMARNCPSRSSSVNGTSREASSSNWRSNPRRGGAQRNNEIRATYNNNNNNTDDKGYLEQDDDEEYLALQAMNSMKIDDEEWNEVYNNNKGKEKA